MKYCYKDFCVTGTSILGGILLSLLFLIVYSNNTFILIKDDKK